MKTNYMLITPKGLNIKEDFIPQTLIDLEKVNIFIWEGDKFGEWKEAEILEKKQEIELPYTTGFNLIEAIERNTPNAFEGMKTTKEKVDWIKENIKMKVNK